MSFLRSSAREALVYVAGKGGYRLVPNTGGALGDPSSAGALAAHLRELFVAAGIDGVIDVGANKGQYYDFLRQHVRFRGPVVSFEPNPALVAMLQERAQSDPLWTVVGCALGGAEATLPLKVMTGSGWSSLLDKATVSASERANTFEVERVVDVPVRPLDTVLAELPTFRSLRPYLKIDAQGYDLEVLKGAPLTLARSGALQTELGLIAMYDDAPHYTSMLRYLQDQQHEMTGAFLVWRDSSLRIGEMDAVFRNMRAR